MFKRKEEENIENLFTFKRSADTKSWQVAKIQIFVSRSASHAQLTEQVIFKIFLEPEHSVLPTEEYLLLQISNAELVPSAKTASNGPTFVLKTPWLNHNGGANPDLFLQMPNLEGKVTTVSGFPLW